MWNIYIVHGWISFKKSYKSINHSDWARWSLPPSHDNAPLHLRALSIRKKMKDGLSWRHTFIYIDNSLKISFLNERRGSSVVPAPCVACTPEAKAPRLATQIAPSRGALWVWVNNGAGLVRAIIWVIIDAGWDYISMKIPGQIWF